MHGNDWQSGAATAHWRDCSPHVRQILTIHNASYHRA
ncbi:glycogen/starch synthase [Streptomyces sp. NBC_00467]